jgi:hypothetical protein
MRAAHSLRLVVAAVAAVAGRRAGSYTDESVRYGSIHRHPLASRRARW